MRSQSKRHSVAAIVLLMLSSLNNEVDGGNIFMWMHFGGRSHLVVWKPLVLELAKRGHHITFVGPYPDKDLSSNPNITYAHTDNDMDHTVNSTAVFLGENALIPIDEILKGSLLSQEKAFNLPIVQKLLTDKPKFDVAIISPMCLDLGLYMAKEYFQAPIIGFFFGLKCISFDKAVHNPLNPSYIPADLMNFGQHMTFPERLVNTIAWSLLPFLDAYRISYVNTPIQELLQLPEKPDMNAMLQEIDFALNNNHLIFESVKPTNPNSADIGGLHLRPAKEIDDFELKEWMDAAKDGFVYVSFGSVLKGSSMPDIVKDKLLKAFADVGMKILWKWETESMVGKPGNVLLKKWLPQQDVLGHPNCKLFVTHSGLISTYETIYHKVPIVTMPGFADQPSLAIKAERNGYGKRVDWGDLTAEKLSSAMKEVLSNPSYKETVDKLSAILSDRLVHPLEEAVYRVEYIMRHNGADFLRSPSKDLYWFQHTLLDVVTFIMAVILIILIGIIKTCKCICSRARASKRASDIDKRKKKQ